ncbi:DUF4340 domain-containing protein [Prolixibacter sp. NT017]|uniref:DUF4340 domain-containing protein n=1 Tax=Prolixibacter sp. NT017 TaxID=2652390 RepID=UPI0012833EAD|nr:DUF4340 domain-containing protein [Prolixibacter sp. NT017]GET23829.1 hypothetical protein NT017_01580 [Prolixibacter sp. NT017]
MFRRIGIRSLAVAFAVLLVAVVLVKIDDSRKGDQTFNSQLTSFSTTKVTAIELTPKQGAEKMLRFEKHNNHWNIVIGGKILSADNNVVVRMLSAISDLKARSLVSSSEKKFDDFGVADSSGTHVVVYEGKEKLADLVLGKFTYSKPHNLTTYVRLMPGNDVFAVEGYLPMLFNRKVDEYRDHRIVHMVTSDITKLAFSYATGKSFTLVNEDGKWKVNGVTADSAKVAGYLQKLGNLKGTAFAEKNEVNSAPVATLDITRKDEEPIVTVTAYQDGQEQLVKSSQNPSAVFNDPKAYKTVFVPKNYFKP